MDSDTYVTTCMLRIANLEITDSGTVMALVEHDDYTAISDSVMVDVLGKIQFFFIVNKIFIIIGFIISLKVDILNCGTPLS